MAIGLLAALVGPIAHSGPALAQDGAVVDWIRRTAQPCESCEPRDDHQDLASLRQIVGNAHVVALGEGTVGTREFVQLKHRIIEYLASEMGFSAVAIPANMPETRALNDYIQTGKGDPRALISWYWLKYWPLNTEEMLAFVEWMRAYNASGRGRPLQLVGFDMIKPNLPTDVVREYLRRVDPEWADSLEALSRALTRARQTRAQSVSLQGDFPAVDAAGHHVRLSGWIRTENVSDYAGLWCRADAGDAMVVFNNMERQPVKGTRGWQRYALELDIPANADHVVFGAQMPGTGRAWFDSLGIEIDGKPWSDPNKFDLPMESAGGPIGFQLTPGPGYDIRMDDSTAAVGRRSLRLSSVEGFVPPDPTPLWAAAEKCASRIVQRFESEGQRYRRASSDDETAWAARNAHLLLQRTRVSLQEGSRDSSIAANVEWIMERLPKQSKIVVWAHNDEVARTPGSMGDWLAKRFGKDMVVVGFATNEGQCTTAKTSAANLEATEIQPGPDGSFEALARASGVPRFLLDLRRAKPGSQIAARLHEGLTLRSIGLSTPKQEFFPAALSREFDVIAWVEKTQATRTLATH
ncbi:MAG: erythromycin esterase family protein [Candidatus Eisenbacteria bacterium]|uniref:Erythromycin esterase family protein n=1 Tax=Eiseniibacteriota bacterium TaxID=2212470 RepID=A0A538THY7_UNCEI|nr:MAG: erythromycin esterase family protein [Candidatus Eisenbacteria bacterium]TMQ63230.1 MAG: erythromycin esterase family protein [Candidatus Eisenbacteria bacterium]